VEKAERSFGRTSDEIDAQAKELKESRDNERACADKAELQEQAEKAELKHNEG